MFFQGHLYKFEEKKIDFSNYMSFDIKKVHGCILLKKLVGPITCDLIYKCSFHDLTNGVTIMKTI